jgi:Zn-dependent protease
LPDIDIAQLFIAFLVLLFSLTVHESAHAWTAYRLGDPTAKLLGRVSLNPLVHIDPVGTILFPIIAFVTRLPLIGWAKPVPVNQRQLRHPKRDYMLVAAAGPASNLLLASIAAVVLRQLPLTTDSIANLDVSAPLAIITSQTIGINVLLAVFNMIPIPPLDGGNVLAGLLPGRLGDTFNHVVRPYGFLIIYVLMLTGALGSLVGPTYYLLLSWLR